MTRSTSIVTVCMNRREHLLQTAAKVAEWPHHSEHLIVDWSSRSPICRDELPADSRLRLLRVDGEASYNPSRAYNFALAQAQGTCLFKLDADCWPQHLPHPDCLAMGGLVSCFGSGSGGRFGQWLLDRSLWQQVGGFNELLRGYGFEDKDFRARLKTHAGLGFELLPETAIGVISHSVALRGWGAQVHNGLVGFSHARALKRTTSLANRVMAASCPWSASLPRSQYRQDAATGHWCLVPDTAPRAPEAVRWELRRLRRETFWSEFLWIPAAVVRELPERLLPAERSGGFTPALWHRGLWWLLHLPQWPPVMLLSASRGGLSGLRAQLAAARQGLRRPTAQFALRLLATPMGSRLPAALQRLGLEARAERALATGVPPERIWADLLILQQRFGSHALVHRLLFRRGFRPRQPAHEVQLFEAIAAEPSLPEPLRAYARISLGYRSLKDDDYRLAQQVSPAIEAMAAALAADPATRLCCRGNRQSRLKLLVSCYTVLSHLQLLLGDEAGLRRSAEGMLLLLEGLSWPQVPADVAFRLLTNAARGVGFAALLAWRANEAPQLERTQAVLDLLQREATAERHRGSGAQENHRHTVAQFRQYSLGLVLGDVASARPLVEQLLNVRTPALQEQLKRLLR